MQNNKKQSQKLTFDRSTLFKFGLYTIGGILLLQLFLVQIVRHDYYTAEALAEHVKKFEIPAKRGIISLSDGYGATPVVLNETKYIVYADPKFVQDTEAAATKLQSVIGGNTADIKDLLTSNSRYVILAKKIDEAQSKRIEELKIKGVGLKEISVRSYPQGTVAAHVLGFVNDDGKGQYGFEEYYNDQLAGKSGQQKIITDVNGVPLAINNDSVQTQPDPGAAVTLSLDIRLQRIIEEKLKEGVERTQAEKGSAVLIDPNTGQVKAMADFPTFDPSQYANQEDLGVFTNTAISAPYEPGSVMKPIMLSTALQEGSVTRNTTYFDPGYKKIADTTVTNSENYGARVMTMDDILTKSLNTGAVHLFQSLGGGEITDASRRTWYDYLTLHYLFNKPTGIELANEQGGKILPPEDNGAGINVTYANMAFGQGLTVTPMQLAAAYSALINGGTYYQPTIISEYEKDGQMVKQEPKVVNDNVISDEVSATVKDILAKTLEINNKPALRAGYTLGAKSGTAELADGNGNYREDTYNGTYIGYIEGKKLEYVMIVRLDKPKTSGYASRQAAIVWAQISNEIFNSIAIEPKQ